MASEEVTLPDVPMLAEATELARLLEPDWEPMSHALRTSGVPLNEGEGGDGGDGSGSGDDGGGDGAGDGDGDGDGSGSGDAGLSAADKQIISEAKDPDAVRNLIVREREARKTWEKKAGEEAAKSKKLEDAEKSDREKLEDERDTLKTEGTGAKSEALRLRVAIEKKVPSELVDRLRGETKEELEDDADELLKLVKSPEDGDPDPATLDGGVRTTPADDSDVSPGLGRLSAAYASSSKKKN